jgi:hypothetical protein
MKHFASKTLLTALLTLSPLSHAAELSCDQDESPLFSATNDNSEVLLCLSRADELPYKNVTIKAKVFRDDEIEPRIYNLRGTFSPSEGMIKRVFGDIIQMHDDFSNIPLEQISGVTDEVPLLLSLRVEHPPIDQIETNECFFDPACQNMTLKIGDQSWQKTKADIAKELEASTCHLASTIVQMVEFQALRDLVEALPQDIKL